MRSRLLLLGLVSSVACSVERALAPHPQPERTYVQGCDTDGHCGMQLMPLLIVDGELRPWNSPGRTLRPEDIAFIDVLKGDKAVVRYGEEARDGIVVVTTTRARRR